MDECSNAYDMNPVKTFDSIFIQIAHLQLEKDSKQGLRN